MIVELDKVDFSKCRELLIGHWRTVKSGPFTYVVYKWTSYIKICFKSSTLDNYYQNYNIKIRNIRSKKKATLNGSIV